jgi:NAD(P)-dependent dehydrogenase (short-subunit alcohol dehydrogenase family)
VTVLDTFGVPGRFAVVTGGNRGPGRAFAHAPGEAGAFGAAMVEAGGGVIVNAGSMSGQIVNRPQWQPACNGSKARVHRLTTSLPAEWAPPGVHVNALAPGMSVRPRPS